MKQGIKVSKWRLYKMLLVKSGNGGGRLGAAVEHPAQIRLTAGKAVV